MKLHAGQLYNSGKKLVSSIMSCMCFIMGLPAHDLQPPSSSLCGLSCGLAHTAVGGACYAIGHAMLMSACHAAREAFLVAMKQSSASNGDSCPSGHEAMVGYICGTLSAAEKLTHESMSRHDPEGDMLCIHSVRPASLA